MQIPLIANSASATPIIVISIYLCLLLGLAMFSKTLFRGTSTDYFVASRSIGPFMLLMSVFGTTMTAFALVGSTGKAFERGVGTYGLMASCSGLIHAACSFIEFKDFKIVSRFSIRPSFPLSFTYTSVSQVFSAAM